MEDPPFLLLLLLTAVPLVLARCYTNLSKKKNLLPQHNHNLLSKPMPFESIGIVGAGAIGTCCGLSLSRMTNLKRVVLVGRKSLVTAVETNNGQLRLLDKTQQPQQGMIVQNFAVHICNSLATTRIPLLQDNSKFVAVTENLDDLVTFQCSVIIVASKATATETIAKRLAKVLPLDSNATIVSFQNGIRNADILREALQNHKNVMVLSSMVSFSAGWKSGTNLFSKTSDGSLEIQRPTAKSMPLQSTTKQNNVQVHAARMDSLAAALTTTVIPTTVVADVLPAQNSKLLINLFNAVNALAGISTPATMEKAGYRKVWAAAISEGLAVYSKLGMSIGTYRGLSPKLLPLMKVLPEMAFKLVFRIVAKVDYDSSKSSMLQDMERGRTETEVDFLCGEIVQLGKKANVPTPVNEALVRLVTAAQTAGKGSPQIAPDKLVVLVGLEKPSPQQESAGVKTMD
ncbi:Catalyzes the NADPH-dependent reduction of ketopantoate into pantoic acid (By similarity) [Seminavis robusta]|uniref:Catalyzes the NADPH-dependent reduction of ketopantoate into pantoic acid By similarity n=1 Tax=Seminavis robusta TaxID=568900 RepID=A0A9N8F5X1_9STRA|nr:Catalyzes the NADPH-dependent reduction of ketopantoate into pantoic acid (By similarity) [Seminavis robusta]|eukprot:Sro3691_g350360.1 Catalyzes the NADPH-dependent reduction of ketopantoate into pantoic acid (By similarity) (457) ;mRNA; r:1226-2596